MGVRFPLALAVALVLSAQIPATTLIRADTDNKNAGQPAAQLQPESRLLLIRDVNGEFAHVVLGLPGGKKGFRVAAGKPVNSQNLRDALRLQGQAAGPGDMVQITAIDFRGQEIIFQINGGPRKHFHLRDHLTVGAGPAGTPDDAPPPPSHPNEGLGATLVLDFHGPIPDMSADQLKQQLSAMLQFSTRSAATSWMDTLPPQFQQGIKDHRAVLGMNRETLVAAMGRPDKKVRERDLDGIETEDWIYGEPPDKTTFVTFEGDTVVNIKEYN